MATTIGQRLMHSPIETIPTGNRREQMDSSPVVLIEALNSLHKALAVDKGEARQLVARAADLLDGAVRNRAAGEQSRITGPVNRRLAPWQAGRATEYVESNLAGTIRIEKMAELTRLSDGYFSKAFRSDFGESPYAYVIRRRIELAKEMMLRTDESLAYIARACGLADQPHLTRLFRRFSGTSPASWRRQHRLRNHDDAPHHADLPAFANVCSAVSADVAYRGR